MSLDARVRSSQGPGDVGDRPVCDPVTSGHVRATGLGSWPGTDMAATLRMVFGEVVDLPYLPELPDRGVGAQLIGRGCALLDGLGADLQPSGWRLTDGDGVDLRRARSLVRRDLDDLEEQAQGYAGPVKLQVVGPWTLAALVQLPRGAPVLSDHGARRELAASLLAGVASLLGELRRRLPAVQWHLQIDEPMMSAVQLGRVETASGYGRLRSVSASELADALRGFLALADAVTVHSCAAQVDLAVLQSAGATSVAVDAGLASSSELDTWASWLESGRDLWLGVVATGRPHDVTADAVVDQTLSLLRRWSVDPAVVREHVWLTPACGLAGWPWSQAVSAQRAVVRAAELVNEHLAG